MARVEENPLLKLDGGSRATTNNSVVSPVVIHNDASNIPNTIKLHGSNYPLWSKVLEMQIIGRGKKGFMIRSIKEPKEESVKYETWETGNAIVKWWLINSMDLTIMGFFIHLRTAKEIYELKVKSFRLRQERHPISVYYADLKVVWQELDQRSIKMECAIGLKMLQEKIQLDQIYAFLAGLDDVFDNVCSDIFRTQPLPSVDEVFSIVRCEAQRHATMMGGSSVGSQGGIPTPSVGMLSRPLSAG
ncbi:uncharacterized protein [Pyrus communis]|uniref:uncharacterized protein n=1 Tax=Pyrus communis TaxID=23211 RepID=UPI0035C0A38D